MICCKIMSNFNDGTVSIAKVLKTFGSLGWLIWDGQYIFFANVDSYEVDESKVRYLLKKNGVKSFYIQIYDKNTDLREKEDINAWILDKLIKINYKTYEDRSQEVFRNISKGLDMLDAEIKRVAQQQALDQNNIKTEEAECIEQEKT